MRCSSISRLQVKGIIAEQLGVELDSVVPAASFTEDLGADSLDAVELIMAAPECFGEQSPCGLAAHLWRLSYRRAAPHARSYLVWPEVGSSSDRAVR